MIIISVARMFILFFINQSVHALHDKPSAACKILKDAVCMVSSSNSYGARRIRACLLVPCFTDVHAIYPALLCGSLCRPLPVNANPMGVKCFFISRSTPIVEMHADTAQSMSSDPRLQRIARQCSGVRCIS